METEMKKVLDYKTLARNALLIGGLILVVLFARGLKDPITGELDFSGALSAVVDSFGGWLGLGALALEMFIAITIGTVLYLGFAKPNSRNAALGYTVAVAALVILAGVIGFAWMRAPQWDDLWTLFPILGFAGVVFKVTPRKLVPAEAPEPVQVKPPVPSSPGPRPASPTNTMAPAVP